MQKNETEQMKSRMNAIEESGLEFSQGTTFHNMHNYLKCVKCSMV